MTRLYDTVINTYLQSNTSKSSVAECAACLIDLMIPNMLNGTYRGTVDVLLSRDIIRMYLGAGLDKVEVDCIVQTTMRKLWKIVKQVDAVSMIHVRHLDCNLQVEVGYYE